MERLLLWHNEKRVLNSSDSFFSRPACHLDNSRSSHLKTCTPTSSFLAQAWPCFSGHNFLYIILLRAESLCTSLSLFQYQEIWLTLYLSLYTSCCSFLHSSEYTFFHHQFLPNSRIPLRIETVFQGCFSIMDKTMIFKIYITLLFLKI